MEIVFSPSFRASVHLMRAVSEYSPVSIPLITTTAFPIGLESSISYCASGFLLNEKVFSAFHPDFEMNDVFRLSSPLYGSSIAPSLYSASWISPGMGRVYAVLVKGIFLSAMMAESDHLPSSRMVSILPPSLLEIIASLSGCASESYGDITTDGKKSCRRIHEESEN